MPRKPTKKAEKSVRMKPEPLPLIGLQTSKPTGKIIAAHIQNCESKMFTEIAGGLGWILCQPFRVTELPSTTTPLRSTGDEGKKLEEIRKMAERWKRRFWEANRGKDEAVCGMAAAGMMILRILESTPTAKGRRGK